MAYSLGIIGAGNMAEAIARGVIAAGLFSPHQILAADPSPQRRALFTEELKIHAIDDGVAVARQAKLLLLSIKPQQMPGVLTAIAPALSPDTLLLSIAAGVSTASIERALGPAHPWRIVRAMPNTPMLIREGIAAIAPGRHARPDDLAAARDILQSAGKVIQVPEDQFDAVTALSGSGPAYFFFLVEHMVRAGVELGLSPQDAHQLAAQTALGAARMLISGGDSPQELRRKVTSPGGTTHAAITCMEDRQLPDIIVQALKAAHQRARELGV